MNLIAVDTSSQNLSVYIRPKNGETVDINSFIKFGASEFISSLDKNLKKLSLDLNDINTFIIGSGPGSFTGLRISFSIVKAFMMSLDVSVYSVSSFFSCAYPYRKAYDKIAVISDARKNLIYLSCFKSKKGILEKEGKEKLVDLKNLAKTKKDYFFISYDLSLREKVLEIEPKINFCSKAIYPKARYLAQAPEHLKLNNISSVDKLKPLYLHPKTCQVIRV